MSVENEFIASGSVTSPAGFCAGATYAGIKKDSGDVLDLGILFSESPCAAAAVFTTNRIKAAPVLLSQERLQKGKAVAVVVNSGCANACTGNPGLSDAAVMAELAAQAVGVPPGEVLVASTGVIGVPLPMEKVRAGMAQIALSRDGGHGLAKAIMTTDTVPKEVAVRTSGFTIGGVAKGSGMICPELATMLCFLTTDAAVEPDFLRSALREAVALSFNMVSVDGDTSPNDMVLLMANGRAGGEVITGESQAAGVFEKALNDVCVYLARWIARDGEGASKLIEVTVNCAPDVLSARRVARTVAGSFLVKAAVHGSDPNWGRIMAAVGRSGVAVVAEKIDLAIGDVFLLKAGAPLPFNREEVRTVLDGVEVPISVWLNLGEAVATAWGCDLSEEYVTINSEYTT